MIRVKVIEQSFIAKLASKYLHTTSMAIVFGKTIYLHGASKEKFIKNKRWLRHEVEHVLQYQRYGFLKFLFLYCRESFKKGYYKNKFEKAARAGEDDLELLEKVGII